MTKTVLVISNGRGEDSITITILEKLKKVVQEEEQRVTDVSIITLPLVDDGSAYKNKGYDTAATWKTLPSKGFGAANFIHLYRDIKNGLFDILKKQAQVISRESQQADVIVTVGDVIPFIFACLWGNHKKIVHIGTAISAYIRNYSLFEMYLFRKYAACVVCRDQKTADQLVVHGVNAVYYGNPMMDDPLLKKTEVKLGLDIRKKHIVLIPSSREDAYDNTVRMLSIIKRIGKKPSYSFCISLAPNLSLSILAKACAEAEWQLTDFSARKKPIVAEITNAEANPVMVVRGYFRDCLIDATAIFGMTGTGNEQIAGLGIPIILLQGKSEAASRSRMVHYQKLLGEAVFVPHGSEQKMIEQIVAVLEDQRKLNRMSETGKQRMGFSGGAYHIARKIYYYIFQK